MRRHFIRWVDVSGNPDLNAIVSGSYTVLSSRFIEVSGKEMMLQDSGGELPRGELIMCSQFPTPALAPGSTAFTPVLDPLSLARLPRAIDWVLHLPPSLSVHIFQEFIHENHIIGDIQVSIFVPDDSTWAKPNLLMYERLPSQIPRVPFSASMLRIHHPAFYMTSRLICLLTLIYVVAALFSFFTPATAIFAAVRWIFKRIGGGVLRFYKIVLSLMSLN
jgi:hypothetical protein